MKEEKEEEEEKRSRQSPSYEERLHCSRDWLCGREGEERERERRESGVCGVESREKAGAGQGRQEQGRKTAGRESQRRRLCFCCLGSVCGCCVGDKSPRIRRLDELHRPKSNA